MRTAIELCSVSKQFKNSSLMALDHATLSIGEGEFITILGPSKSGKTTLLNMMNRLCEFDSGEIKVFGQTILDTDPVKLRRSTGYVFKQIDLFPHKTIHQNIASVPKMLGWKKPAINSRVAEVLQLVNLDPKLSLCYPRELTTAQQQRVGLARALAADPPILLFDDPFFLVNSPDREALQDTLAEIHKQTRKTFVLTTTSVNEALKLSTRIVVLDGGKVVKFDTPQNIRDAAT